MESAPSIGRYTALIRRLDAIGRREGFTLEVLDVLRRGGYALPFFVVRCGPERAVQVCVSAGIHGDEPAGVEAIVRHLEQSDGNDGAVGLTVFPCLNPSGYIAGSRRNDVGFDLNRTFGQEPAPIETELVRQRLAGQRFALALDLHEDSDARGFYLYEHVRAERARLGPRIVSRIAALGMPIQDSDSIEGRRLIGGCVEPAEEQVSETVGFLSIYLFDRHCDHTLNPETPAAMPMPSRVAMHLMTLATAVTALARAGAGDRADTRR
ncbi:MAG TPA: M14 family metallocarboxypeptidase [Candidatus Tumulicola sp.]|nr:M14 family metallocarboxypeptidase [Candidatus Tumulicola sp.]